MEKETYCIDLTQDELQALCEFLNNRGCLAKDFHSAKEKIEKVLIDSQN